MDYEKNLRQFDLDRIDLQLFTAGVAIEIDNYLEGRPSETKDVYHLSKLLKDFIDHANQPEHIYDSELFVLARAIAGEKELEEY